MTIELDELELELVKTLVKMDLLESKETLEQNIRILEGLQKKLK